MIESFAFGAMVVNGRKYASDLIIFPNGRVQERWWRRRGHVLTQDDIQSLLDAGPDMIIAGTGMSGRMTPESGLSHVINNMGIQFFSVPNEKAVKMYNLHTQKARVGACFHLTC